MLWPRDGDLLGRAPNHEVMQHPDHVILQSHLTNENHYIFTAGVLMATKLGWIVAHFIGLLPIKLHDPLIT